MASITMWRFGDRRCVLRVDRGQFELHVIEDGQVLYEQHPKSADKAVLLAEIWRETYAEVGGRHGSSRTREPTSPG